MVFLRVVDLFSGCGGLSLGFQNARFEISAAFDHWKPSVDVYRKNFDHEIFEVDLVSESRNLDTFSKYEPDMVIGGPPCQDFSHAGKRDEEGGRADLTVTFADIVTGVRPKWFVMENVERIIKSKRLDIVRRIFSEAGYGLTMKVLDASLCGVPQKRKRFFMVGELGGYSDSLLRYLEKNLADEPMTVRDYMGEKLDVEHYYRHPRNYSRRAIYSVDEPSMTIRGVNRPVPGGYPGHPGDSVIMNPDIRPLTTVERSYIQTFPEEFVFEGSKTNMELMIGNAVPVKLAEYVARCIGEYINDEPSPETLFDPASTEKLYG
ncbi:MAG: DNA cytosine methyltransferase [Actinomycetota bacterium]|nr:DNA cytosine methyltransferase [Actinomycetota bacterium]